MRNINLFLMSSLLCFVLTPLAALAQTSGAPPVTADTVTQLLLAVQGHQWVLVAGLACTIATFALRNWATIAVPWFRTNRGGVVMSSLVSLLGSLGVAWKSGNWNLPLVIGTAAAYLATSSGIYTTVKNSISTNDPVPADPVAKPAGFASLRLLMVFSAMGLLLVFTGCAGLKATLTGASTSVQGGPNGATATVTMTTGTQVSVTVDAKRQCASDTHWVPVSFLGLECNTVCVAEVPKASGGATAGAGILCRPIGQPDSPFWLGTIPAPSATPTQTSAPPNN